MLHPIFSYLFIYYICFSDEDDNSFGCIHLMNPPLGTHFLHNIDKLYNDGGSPNKIGIHFTFKVKVNSCGILLILFSPFMIIQ